MDKKFLKTYFFCVTGTLLLAFLLWNWEDTAGFLRFVLHAFRPVVIGAVLAFLLNRPFERLKKLFCWAFPSLRPKTNNVLAVVTLYILLIGVLAAVLGIVVPQLIKSFHLLVSNLDSYYQNAIAAAEELMRFGGHNWWDELQLEQKLLDAAKYLPHLLQALFSGMAAAVSGVAGTVADCIIGLVISIYGLAQKNKLSEQGRRVLKAFLRKRSAAAAEFLSLFSHTFSCFFSGQLVEAGILGLLCFVGMSLFGFDYAVLISVLAAITNLVPIIGPVVGAAAGAFILFLSEPAKALWFLIFIIVLQQIEANFIYPKVVGESVGLPGIWVLISVVTGGSLFGIAGMLFAVPSVSVLYQLIKRHVSRKCGPEPPDDGKKELIVYQNEKKKP